MNDYKELVEELRDKYNEDRCKRLTLEAADAIEDLRHRLSLAEQAGEPKRGEWVSGREIGRSFIGDLCVDIQYEDWSCSICNESIKEIFRPRYKYCPHCGAKMKVQE